MVLSYQHSAVEGLLRSRTGLCIFGRGLGVQDVLLEALRRALADGRTDERHAERVVILLNTSQEEAELLAKRASEDPNWAGLYANLIVVGPDLSVEERAAAFARGGAFIVSARLLVPDILSGRLLPDTIDGLFVNHAHSISELSADAFVLRLFRQATERGFIRAISDMPDAFNRSSTQLEKVMHRCFINQLEVWPRIRKDVQDCLQRGTVQPDVRQLTLELPKSVQDIQRHILNIVQGTLEELKKDPNLELGHIQVKDSVSAAFDAELRQVLDPVRQSLGPRARRLVNDLGGIRRLLVDLLGCDAVEFHSLLESLCQAENERAAPAWIFSPDAQALLALAKARVYEIDSTSGPGGHTIGVRRTLEPHPKWQTILDIVDRTIDDVAAMPVSAGDFAVPRDFADKVTLPPNAESHNQCQDADNSDSDLEIVSMHHVAKKPRTISADAAAGDRKVLEPRLLVIVPDDRSRRQLSTLLHRGPRAALLDTLGAYLRERSSRGRQEASGVDAGSMLHGKFKAGEAALLAKEAGEVAREIEQLEPKSVLQMRQLPDGRPCHPRVDIVAGDASEGQLEARLHEMHPHAVVFFEPSLPAIRAFEVHCASLPGSASSSADSVTVKMEKGVAQAINLSNGEHVFRPKAHLLVFEDSVEKYRFQQALVEESQAVDSIIRAKQHLTVRLDNGMAPGGMAPETEQRSSRRGGGSRKLDAMIKQKVVVDMREFRSALPFMLHLRNLTIEPVTIPVGDYVLSRDICVERKAIPDLIQSLASGRLYQQAQNMCHHYANPCLLIEFDPSKSFALQNSYTIARREIDVGTRDILGKIALLVLHFPKLRVIWSPSPHFTADIFLKLKEGRYQPDSKSAAQVDAEDLDDDDTNKATQSRSNAAAFDVLRKLPGVTPRNMHPLARRAKSLAGLLDLSMEDLISIMGKACAQELFTFLNANVLATTTQEKQEMRHAAEVRAPAAEEADACAPRETSTECVEDGKMLSE